mmetsp:Transcript_2282/g.3138  ORF Transcript_2282/g.3138 Transcript_2282/m.3138 type:complete len:91 (+) Transcript_2282:142-414(+)
MRRLAKILVSMVGVIIHTVKAAVKDNNFGSINLFCFVMAQGIDLFFLLLSYAFTRICCKRFLSCPALAKMSTMCCDHRYRFTKEVSYVPE